MSIIANPSSQIICDGGTANISIGPTGSGPFTWSVIPFNVIGAIAGSGPLISQILTLNDPEQPGDVIYVIFGGGVNTTNAAVDVNPIPIVTANPTEQTINSGQTTNISLTSNIGGISWTVESINVTGALPGSGNTISQTLINTSGMTGTVTYTISASRNGCVGPEIQVVITVVSIVPDVIVDPSSQTICSGENVNIVLSSNLLGTTFSWIVNAENVLGALPGTGNIINQTLFSEIGGNVVYTITPSNNGVAGPSAISTVFVNPIPSLIVKNKRKCIESGCRTLIKLSSLVGATFTWTVQANRVTGAENGQGNIISQKLKSKCGGSVIYTVVATVNGCQSEMQEIRVCVEPSYEH